MRQPKQVSGALAPFSDEMTLVFAGPVELYQLAVCQPGAGSWPTLSDAQVAEQLAAIGTVRSLD